VKKCRKSSFLPSIKTIQAMPYNASHDEILPCPGVIAIHASGHISRTQAPPFSLSQGPSPKRPSSTRIQGFATQVIVTISLSIEQRWWPSPSQLYPSGLSKPCWEEVQQEVNRHCRLLGWCRHFEARSFRHQPDDCHQSSLDFLHLRSNRHSFESDCR